LFNNSEYLSGAFAGAVALVLVLTLTAMALTALEPNNRTDNSSRSEISAPEPTIIPTFAN
jgi:hypothetical protein